MKISKKKEIELARKFVDLAYSQMEYLDDYVYDELYPDCEYDEDEIIDKFNLHSLKEILELGFKAKYHANLKD